MVKNPEIGGQYWFVTDIWERFCPVPVTIVAVNEEYGALLIRWDIGESEYFEQYEGVWPNELYETQADAAAECRRREGGRAGFMLARCPWRFSRPLHRAKAAERQ